MRVKIGPYKNWVGPYQIADALCFWVRKEKDEYGIKRNPKWVHNFGTWLSGGEDRDSLLHKFCLWVESKRTRTVKVKIDRWDTWSMDHTLGQIALPMLQQLKRDKHGAPLVDDEDVPEYLRSTAAPPKENEYDTDDNHFLRWDWVMDEMIFAFEHRLDDSWEDEFRSGEIDMLWVPVDRDGNEVPKGDHNFYQMKRGPKDTYKCDYEGMKKVQARIDNGFRLFGKYYQALWD
jgi:hypothetical protein